MIDYTFRLYIPVMESLRVICYIYESLVFSRYIPERLGECDVYQEIQVTSGIFHGIQRDSIAYLF